MGRLNKYQLLLLTTSDNSMIYSHGTLRVRFCFTMDILKYKQIMGYFPLSCNLMINVSSNLVLNTSVS